MKQHREVGADMEEEEESADNEGLTVGKPCSWRRIPRSTEHHVGVCDQKPFGEDSCPARGCGTGCPISRVSPLSGAG